MLPKETKEEGDGKGAPGMMPHEPRRVNVDDDHDLIYWSSQFGCTREQLRAAVRSVGSSVKAVEQMLLKGNADPPGESFCAFPKP